MTSKIDDRPQNNPAVLRCREAYKKAYDETFAKLQEMEEEIDEQDAIDDSVDAAAVAYRRAMLSLIGERNIRNFIVCATYGSAIGVIEGPDYTRMLYAAQVAYATRRTRSKKTGKDAKKSQSGANKGAIKAIQEPSPAPVHPA
jgi:hypothetical protein